MIKSLEWHNQLIELIAIGSILYENKLELTQCVNALCTCSITLNQSEERDGILKPLY